MYTHPYFLKDGQGMGRGGGGGGCTVKQKRGVKTLEASDKKKMHMT